MAKSDPDILVICFKPFAGKGKNGSEEVGKRLAETSSRVECEVFEVVWADLHQRVQAVVTKRNYRWVVVLGEGYAHAVVVERVAYKAAAFPDERNERSGPLPPELPSSYVGDLAWPGSSKGKRGPRLPQKHELGLQHPNCGVIEGVNAGVYLCNGTFFFACAVREEQAERPFVGLVHIPPQNNWELCNPKGSYVKVMARVLRVILARNSTRL